MISTTVSLWGNGSVTLPKEWRDRFDTKHFLVKEDKRGYLVIMPILDVEYYEDDEDSFGLKFPHGIEAGELLKIWDEAEENLKKENNLPDKSQISKTSSGK